MTKFFFEFKKPIFGPLPQFLGQSFSKKLGCHAQFQMGFQHPGKIQRNLMIKRQMSGGKDGQTLFHRILPATPRGGVNNKYNCSRLAFKSKNKMCGVGLIKNYSLSNSNYFMSAKKMPTQKLYYRFHVGKNGIHVSSFQKIVFFQIFN